MTTNRVKQILLGSELTDAELEDIPSARMELHTHVLTKFVQVSNQITKIARKSLSPKCFCRCRAFWVPVSSDPSSASNAGDLWQPPFERYLR